MLVLCLATSTVEAAAVRAATEPATVETASAVHRSDAPHVTVGEAACIVSVASVVTGGVAVGCVAEASAPESAVVDR